MWVGSIQASVGLIDVEASSHEIGTTSGRYNSLINSHMQCGCDLNVILYSNLWFCWFFKINKKYLTSTTCNFDAMILVCHTFHEIVLCLKMDDQEAPLEDFRRLGMHRVTQVFDVESWLNCWTVYTNLVIFPWMASWKAKTVCTNIETLTQTHPSHTAACDSHSQISLKKNLLHLLILELSFRRRTSLHPCMFLLAQQRLQHNHHNSR